MPASHPPVQSAVIAADASKPFTPEPLIADLLRTQYCVPGSKLLVEGIEAHIPVSKRFRTIRLILGDGELCIQALLWPEMHRLVDGGQVYVGCYIQLNRTELRSVAVRTSPAEDEQASGGPQQMVFLVVRDMSTVGCNTAYMQMAKTSSQRTSEIPAAQEGSQVVAGSGSEGLRKDRDSSRAVKGTAAAHETGQDQGTTATTQLQRTTGSTASYSATSNIPWASNDLSKPLKLTPLKSVPNLPYKQNWIVNVLAVVTSLSEVELAILPPNKQPFEQRTARLADPSTSKHVSLTVFLDPEEFTPQVGSVVLLIGVKNHRFDGGSLKKYSNERPKEGSRWWVQSPRDIEWCDVEGLERWWAEKSL